MEGIWERIIIIVQTFSRRYDLHHNDTSSRGKVPIIVYFVLFANINNANLNMVDKEQA